MRTAAAQMEAAKPVAPAWTASPVTATMMAGVTAVNGGVAAAVQRGEGFAKTAADGFGLFSEITTLCANDYDHNDSTEAQNIARTSAASETQVHKVDELNQGRYFAYVSHYGTPGNTDFKLPPDGWGVK
ncbi:hypothetical protein E0H73_28615 [Kribbella pittospori]|uniref:Uncharacterized protein n=1 Tax=Kribbella pittospori TaxID=722689 RepID=A0A4R0KEF9_9ACTN|nr:hypothetical protein [Kribbella pittospori]TCC58279.1 hypothetical protein E0H73_28615 [Kribbella pittospori]